MKKKSTTFLINPSALSDSPIIRPSPHPSGLPLLLGHQLSRPPPFRTRFFKFGPSPFRFHLRGSHTGRTSAWTCAAMIQVGPEPNSIAPKLVKLAALSRSGPKTNRVLGSGDDGGQRGRQQVLTIGTFLGDHISLAIPRDGPFLSLFFCAVRSWRI